MIINIDKKQSLIEAAWRSKFVVASIGDLKPKVEDAIYIAENATVVGDVILGKDVSIWFGVVVRGDLEPIRIGDRSNVQDNSVLHGAFGFPLTIGSDVTIGHNAIVHACTVGDGCLIGMGACVLDGAIIPPETMVGAGALVPPGRTYPRGSLIVGSPARVVRALRDDELEVMRNRIVEYVENGKLYTKELKSG